MPIVLVAEELHQPGLVAASLQFVEERGELLVTTAIEWINTANKAEWKYDPDGKPRIWVSEGLIWHCAGAGNTSIESLTGKKR